MAVKGPKTTVTGELDGWLDGFELIDGLFEGIILFDGI